MAQISSRNNPIQWDFIVDKIRQEQCVLVLGPEVNTVNENGTTSREALLEHLDVANNANIYQYYPDDEFFLFDDAYKRTLVCHQIKSFYQSLRPNRTLALLTQIPFHIYLTVTPDSLLQRTFDEKAFHYQSGYYKRHKDPNVIKSPSRKNPLIYNLFGSVESEESIILTHDDLFEYFKSIFAQRSMPDKLKIQLQEVKNFIFLGLPFDKWYMQMLLRELEIHNRQYEFTRFAAGQSVTEQISTFCLDQFRINFISRNIFDFVRQIRQLFDESELRQPTVEGNSGLGQVRKLVGQGDTEAAIDLMEDLVENTDLENDLLQLAGRYRKYRKRALKGILSFEEQRLQENQLTASLLELTVEAKNAGL